MPQETRTDQKTASFTLPHGGRLVMECPMGLSPTEMDLVEKVVAIWIDIQRDCVIHPAPEPEYFI